ncbi:MULTISPECIES: hypothetical protein [unclassified Kitasatospora]|uniref:hypothetical protein n=1 Tax=unclassified Kitasatospora TaxID=2633591 RepID=UPI0033DFFAF6
MKSRFTAMAFLLALLASVEATGTARAAPVTPPVASDCSQDVTDAFNTWLGGVPDGATIRLARNGCYLTNGSITFTQRRNITIEGGGATIKATVDAPVSTNRARLWFDRGGGFVVRDLTLQGTNFSEHCAVVGQPSCYNSAREHDAGVNIGGADGVLLERLHIENTWGDAVELFSGGTWDGQGNGAVAPRDVTVRDSTVHTTGRHAFSCDNCHNYVIEHNDVSNVGYWMTDVEIEGAVWTGDVTLVRNTYRDVYLGLLAAASDYGVKPGPFILRDNVQTSDPVTCYPPVYIAPPSNEYGPAQVTGNSLRSFGTTIALGNVSRADVSGNTTTIQAGGCGFAAGVELVGVPRGEVIHNTFIGAEAVVQNYSSTVTVCGNRTTAAGPYNEPVPCGRV